MEIHFITSWYEVFGALFIGSLFGFFLQKAGVTKSNVIKDQLLLKDFTVMKVILSAIATGSFGLYLYRSFIDPSALIINSTTLSASFFGGGIFGVGMALLGFCPGTCIAALSDKSKTARWGVLGMLLGAFVYSQISDKLIEKFKPKNEINTSLLTDLLGVNPIIIISFIIFIVVFLWALDRKKIEVY